MSEYLNITGYSIVYVIFVLAIFIYTIRNQLDILCVSAVCYIVYSMYCFFGYGISGHYRPALSPQLYLLVYMQLILIMGFICFTRFNQKTRRFPALLRHTQQTDEDVSEDKTVRNAFYIYTAVIALFALVNVIKVGVSGFVAGKATVWENTNILYIISLYGAYPSFAYGIHTKNKWIWIPSLLVELTIFFAGSRAFTATLIVIYLCDRGAALWKKKQKNTEIFLLGAAAIVFLLVYRMVDKAIMQGDIGSVIRTLLSPATWLEALEFNEPRVIIANYDYVLTSGIRLPIGDVIFRILDFIPGVAYIFPVELVYPEYFSDWLMTAVAGSAGVGGSFWGESYAMMGVFGVILFTGLWMMFVNFANHHMKAYHKPYSSFVVALGTYLAWYINRLDFNRVGQSFKVTLLCFLIWLSIYFLLGAEIKVGKKFSLQRDDLLQRIRKLKK